LRDHENEFRNAGATLAAVGLGDLNYARLFREESGIMFPLLVDSERKAYKAAQLKSGNVFHVFRRDNAEARARAKAAGHGQHRLGKDPFQLGASFVFGPGNRDLLIHLNRTFSDNADPKELLAALG
jgi:AhpC/TSA antioxidant enzyme